MDNAHYFGLIVLILFVREGVRKRYYMLLWVRPINLISKINCIFIARILNVFYLKEFLLIKQSTCSRFSYLWLVSTDPIYTWPPTDPVWSALRPSHHYPHTPRVPPSTHSHPSTTSKSRTVDDCSQLGFYNEWEKLFAKDLPFEKKTHKTFESELACSQNSCLL